MWPSGDDFPVNTYIELVKHTESLAYLNKDHLFFYRGQGINYNYKNTQ